MICVNEVSSIYQIYVFNVYVIKLKFSFKNRSSLICIFARKCFTQQWLKFDMSFIQKAAKDVLKCEHCLVVYFNAFLFVHLKSPLHVYESN